MAVFGKSLDNKPFNLFEKNGKDIVLDFSDIVPCIIQNFYNHSDENEGYWKLSMISTLLKNFNDRYIKQYSSHTHDVINAKCKVETVPTGAKIHFSFAFDKRIMPNILINTKYFKSEGFEDGQQLPNSYVMPEQEMLCTDDKPHNLHSILKAKESGELKCQWCHRNLKRNNQIVIFDDDKDKPIILGKNCFERQQGIDNLYNILVSYIADFDWFMHVVVPHSKLIDNTKDIMNDYYKNMQMLLSNNYQGEDLKVAQSFFDKNIKPHLFNYFCFRTTYRGYEKEVMDKLPNKLSLSDFEDFYNVLSEEYTKRSSLKNGNHFIIKTISEYVSGKASYDNDIVPVTHNHMLLNIKEIVGNKVIRMTKPFVVKDKNGDFFIINATNSILRKKVYNKELINFGYLDKTKNYQAQENEIKKIVNNNL